MNRFNRLNLSPTSTLHEQAYAREVSHGGSPLHPDIDSQSIQLFNPRWSTPPKAIAIGCKFQVAYPEEMASRYALAPQMRDQAQPLTDPRMNHPSLR